MKALHFTLRQILLLGIFSAGLATTAALGQQTGGVTTLNDRVTVLESTVASQTAQIAGLQATVTALQANSATVGTTISGLATRITGLQAAVAALQANGAFKIVRDSETFDCSAHPDYCVRGGDINGIVDCPAGTRLLSGGVLAYEGTEPVLGVTPDLVLTWSTPAFSDAGEATGWWGTAVFTSNETTGSYTIVTHAICTGS